MNNHLSFFKRWVVYSLCYLIFLQQPIVVAAELVSLDRAEKFYTKAPLSAFSKEDTAPSEPGPTFFYVQHLLSKDGSLRLELSPDLGKLDSILALMGPGETKPVAAIARTSAGLWMEVYRDYVLTLVSPEEDGVLPPLYVTSLSSVLLETEKLINPLMIHASSIELLKAMQVDSPVMFWAKGEPGAAAAQSASSGEPIILTVKNQAGENVAVEAKGIVKTKEIKGTGSLSIFAGQFPNDSSIFLKQLQILANIENGESGNLCGEDSLWLEGGIKNKGFIRTRGTLVEKGKYIQHFKGSRTFSLNSHQVQALSYVHNGKIYSSATMRLQAEGMKFGPEFRFRGTRFIGNGYTIQTYETTYFEALQYIELKSMDRLDMRARLHVHTFDFPHCVYFGDLSHLSAAREAYYVKIIRELKDSQRSVIIDEKDAAYGVSLSSSSGRFFQGGQIDTATTNVTFQAKYVGHGGTTRSGTICPASVKVIAQGAGLRGTIEASKGVEARVQGPLTINLRLKSPLTTVFARTFDLSGDIMGVLKAKVAGAVRFLDALKAGAIFVEAPSLTIQQSSGSTAGPQEIGSLNAVVSIFAVEKPLILSGPSRVEAKDRFDNHSQITVDGSLQALMPGSHHLGNIDGKGELDLTAPAFHDVEALAFGETRVRPQGGIAVTTEQAVTIEREHTVDHKVGISAPTLTVKADQTANGGMALQSTDGDLTVKDITLRAPGQLLSLVAGGGDLNAQGAKTASDILLMSSSRNGYFGGGIFSAPQMSVSIAGVCDTSTRLADVWVPVSRYDDNWGDYVTTQELQRQESVHPAIFLSQGTTQDGSRAYQYFDVGSYKGQGTKGSVGRYLDGSTWQVEERVTNRVVHYSDGPLTFRSRSTFDLTYGQLTASPLDMILIATIDDVRTKGVDFSAARAWTLSERGNIYEDGESLSTHTHVNRSGCGGDYTYQTTSQRQQQSALVNRYMLSGGRQVDAQGNILPAFLQQVSEGKTIRSQAAVIDAPKGLIVRIAPNGSIYQDPLTLVDTYSQHHQTWGRGYSNNFYEGSYHSREVGGQVRGAAEVIDCLSNHEVAYNRLITDYFLERAQHVTRRAGLSDQSAWSSMSLQKDGDMFSGSGSVYQHQSMNAHMAMPMVQQVGQYIEEKPLPGQSGTTTLEGPVLFSAKASTLVRDQVFKAIQQTMECSSTLQADNFSSFQPQQFTLPQFGSHPLQMLKATNQTLGYANDALVLINHLKSGNYWQAALQIAGKFTTFESTSTEQYSRSSERIEAAPFLDYGRAEFRDISVSGVLAGMLMDSPTGRVRLFDVRAPRFESEAESRSTTTSETSNPLTLSIGHSESWSRQRQFSRGSQQSSVLIAGRPDLRIDENKLEGIGFFTLPTGGDQDFIQRTVRVNVNGRLQDISYLEAVEASSGLPLIPRPTANRVSIGKMSVTAAPYENGFDQESGHSSWGFNGLAIASAIYSGNPVSLWTAVNSLSVGFGGEERHSYHRGTQAMSIAGHGAPITIEDLYTKGKVAVGSGIEAQRHVHEEVEEVHTDSHEVDRGGQALEWLMEGRSLYNNIDSLRDNIRRLRAPAPQPTVDSRSRVALTQRLMSILQEDAAQEAAAERSAARASQQADVDPDAPSNPRGRGRTRQREAHRSTTGHALTLNFLSQAGQDVNDFQNLMTYASGKAKTPRASSPVTRDNKVRLDKAEVNYEAAKSKGAWARFRAASELVDAQQTYDDRIHLRQNQLFRARVTTDAANYVAEHPYQAAAFAAAVALTGGASAAPSILAGLSLGTAGGALGGLAANDFRLQTDQDYLNVGASAVTGAFVPLRALSAAYGARNVLSAAALTGTGMSVVGYTTGSTSMMVDGALLAVPAVFGAGKSLAQKFFARAPVVDNPFARAAANRNVLPLEIVGQRLPVPTAANQNFVRLYDVRATGTGGPSPLFVRMESSGSGGAGVPRGFSGIGHSEGLGASSSNAVRRSQSSSCSARFGGGASAKSPSGIPRQQPATQQPSRITIVPKRSDPRIGIDGGDAVNNGPYDPRAMDKFLKERYGTDAVSSSTLPATSMPNVKLAGQELCLLTPEGKGFKVVFDTKGFPILDPHAVFDTKIPADIILKGNRTLDFKTATADIKGAIMKGSVNPDIFNAEQLSAIMKNSAQIPGYTWHHHQDLGRLQLIPSKIHNHPLMRHVGGFSLSQ